LQKSEGWNEKSQTYIEYFEKAKTAADKFVRGNYLGSIKIYFGTGKEQFYLSESVELFTQRKQELGDWSEMVDTDMVLEKEPESA